MPPAQTQHYGPQFQVDGHNEQPFFQYSQCNGRKKALCVSAVPCLMLPPDRFELKLANQIGINYVGQSAELRSVTLATALCLNSP
jgi:hypothetical protein